MPDGAEGAFRVAREASPRAAALRVGGLVPFTTTDYPGALAAVLFCQGCPWRCVYCHNPHLIPARGGGTGGPEPGGELDFARVLAWLGSRRGLLDAVVFSGGEPTAQPELADAIAAVRALGFAIGVHTGGAYPRRLAQVLPSLDWVGLDVKAPAAEYANVTGVADSGTAALASLERVLGAGVAYEVRTTVHPTLTPPEALERLAAELAARGVTRWVLQPFRATGCADPALAATATGSRSCGSALLAMLRAKVPSVEFRP